MVEIISRNTQKSKGRKKNGINQTDSMTNSN